MFRAATRTTPRALRQTTLASATGRRFASTAPADKKYSFKGKAARWGLAIGALYWYNTSPMFADELPSSLSSEPPQFSDSDLPTVDAVVAEKRKQLEARQQAKQEQAAKEKAGPQPPQNAENTTEVAAPGQGEEKTPEQLEEEAGQQGAFNPETGEINWDCPCLGGMAHGPCGEEFKAAFSCFVYSNEEPKGMDCIDKFQHMQDCFRKYPEVYGAEIADEDAAEAEAEAQATAAGSPAPAAHVTDGTAKDKGAAAVPDQVETAAEPDTSAQVAEKPATSDTKPPQSSEPATEYTTEGHKARPTDAPKGAHPDTLVGDGDAQALKEDLNGSKDSEHGIPKSSFDATSANTKASK